MKSDQEYKLPDLSETDKVNKKPLKSKSTKIYI